jgi:methylated-DNA-protein-cysteine methyltransferase related protein
MRRTGEYRARPVLGHAGLEVTEAVGIFHRGGVQQGEVRMTSSRRQGYPEVWEAVARIPRGRVATYGAIAILCGRPGLARFVGYALHNLPPGIDIPWHRVINARGEISLRGPSAARQRHLLRNEGVAFSDGTVDLHKFGWKTGRITAMRGKHRNVPARRVSNR